MMTIHFKRHRHTVKKHDELGQFTMVSQPNWILDEAEHFTIIYMLYKNYDNLIVSNKFYKTCILLPVLRVVIVY